MSEAVWLETPSGPLFRQVCACGNPVVSRSPLDVVCDAHGQDVCGLAGCLRARMPGSRGSTYALCSLHAKRRYAHGDPFYERPLVVPYEPRYRTAQPAYRTAHQRVQRAKGRAARRNCVDCGEQARDWSYVGGDPNELVDPASGLTYSTRVDLYVPRCRGCHVEYDGRGRDDLGRWAGAGA